MCSSARPVPTATQERSDASISKWGRGPDTDPALPSRSSHAKTRHLPKLANVECKYVIPMRHGRSSDDWVVRSNPSAGPFQFRTQPRVNASHTDIEWKDQEVGENRLDKRGPLLPAGRGVGGFHANQELRGSNARKRDRLGPCVAQDVVERPVAPLQFDKNAGVNQSDQGEAGSGSSAARAASMSSAKPSPGMRRPPSRSSKSCPVIPEAGRAGGGAKTASRSPSRSMMKRSPRCARSRTSASAFAKSCSLSVVSIAHPVLARDTALSKGPHGLSPRRPYRAVYGFSRLSQTTSVHRVGPASAAPHRRGIGGETAGSAARPWSGPWRHSSLPAPARCPPE
jgi:hypothetical protein